ncbi:Single Cache domain-containing protein [Candidatus Magnetomoraceae bacterium gMMP-15]
MRKFSIVTLALILGLCMAAGAIASDPAIEAKVADVVNQLNGGAAPASLASVAQGAPYVFIMQADGKFLVHPSKVGQSASGNVLDQLKKATPAGNWVSYEWEGKTKNTYVKTASSGVIVGCGK